MGHDRRMSFSPLDSALTGPLFVSPAMRAVFGDEARLAAMLAFETALARAQAEAGIADVALPSPTRSPRSRQLIST